MSSKVCAVCAFRISVMNAEYSNIFCRKQPSQCLIARFLLLATRTEVFGEERMATVNAFMSRKAEIVSIHVLRLAKETTLT